MTNTKNNLLQRVYETGFAVDEIVLYLDTHPSCTKGLDYYQDAVKLYAEARHAYESEVGPLTKTDSKCPDYFDWMENPWPWEGGCN